MEAHIPLTISIEWGIPLLAFLIMMVGLLSSSEAALLSVSWLRIRHLLEKGDKRAIVVERVLEKKDKLLSTILFTENLCIILASSVGTAIASEIIKSGAAVIVSTIIITVAVLIFGEITPKTLAANFAEPVALFAARPIELWMWLWTPFVCFFSIIPNVILKMAGKKTVEKDAPSPEELSTIINLSEKHGELDAEEGAFLRNILELAELWTGDVMVPRTKMVAFDINSQIIDIIQKIPDTGYSRFPIYENSLDQIVGFIDIRDLLPAAVKEKTIGDIKEYLRPPVFVPESQRVGKLLTRMKKEHFQMAIVLDEYGGTAGLVTLTDLVEEIVGELEAHRHKDDKTISSDNNSIIVASETKLEDMTEWLGFELPEEEYTTIGGLVFSLMGHEPKEGESIENRNLKFTVIEKKGYKISKVMIAKIGAL